MSPEPTATVSGRADARRNREQILDAAAPLLASNPGVTIGEIATAAGLGRATVYRHFPDVAAIQSALRDEAREAGKGLVRDRLTSRAQPGWCDGSLGDQLLQMTRDNLPKRSRWVDTLEGEEIQDEELIATFTPVVAALIRQAQSRGEFRQDVDVDTVASTYVALSFRATRLHHARGVSLDLALEPLAIFVNGLRRR